MKILFIFLTLLSTQLSKGNTTCVAALPRFLDPHRMINPLQLEISEKLFLPLFPDETPPGLLKSWSSAEGMRWKWILNSNKKFHQSQGCRSSRLIKALDVEYGIKRQLLRSAQNSYEKTTFLPARWVSLERQQEKRI